MPHTVSPRAELSSEKGYGHHVPGDTGKHIPMGPSLLPHSRELRGSGGHGCLTVAPVGVC